MILYRIIQYDIILQAASRRGSSPMLDSLPEPSTTAVETAEVRQPLNTWGKDIEHSHTYLHYVCMYVCIYIYIYIERERERDILYIYIYIYIVCIYIYIYIYISKSPLTPWETARLSPFAVPSRPNKKHIEP